MPLQSPEEALTKRITRLAPQTEVRHLKSALLVSSMEVQPR